ncbi:MAG: type II toxin-antitoxin system MqsR family toxin [Nitrospirae bacterium]|nr:type II toxin-antitoxin system MqsR family toxin [Nitrospirota bacterium]
MNETTKRVREFLMVFKQIADRRGIDVVPRRVNNQTLADIGLTKKNRYYEILSLSVQDYCRGPLVDDSGMKGEVWVFGKSIENVTIYIKLKIAEIEEKPHIAKCISFHEAKHPLKFPCMGAK